MEAIKKLEWLNQRRKLGLFVGAGISKGCGMPDWDELVSDLAYTVWGIKDAKNIFNGNLLHISRALRETLGNRFEEEVEKRLYQNQPDYSNTLLSIAEAGIHRICSFNFDNLLEGALSQLKIPCEVVLPGDAFDRHLNKTIVFHPHGYLDYSSESTSIVFSEHDYHSLYSDPYCWSNLIQMNMLMSFSILFIGMSLTDPNLRRLLDSTRTISVGSHFAIMKRKGTEYINFSIEKDLSSLGIDIVWVDEYSEIEDILTKVKRNPHQIGPEAKKSRKRKQKKSTHTTTYAGVKQGR